VLTEEFHTSSGSNHNTDENLVSCRPRRRGNGRIEVACRTRQASLAHLTRLETVRALLNGVIDPTGVVCTLDHSDVMVRILNSECSAANTQYRCPEAYVRIQVPGMESAGDDATMCRCVSRMLLCLICGLWVLAVLDLPSYHTTV
jgi:hypothetical protein